MKEEGLPLRRRVPGAERAGPAPWVRPTLSDALMQRMQAAVDAAKGESAGQDPDTAPIPRTGAEAASADEQSPALNGSTAEGGTSGPGGVQVKRGRAGKPNRFVRQSGDAAPAGNVSDDRASRLSRTALATGTAFSKSAEPESSELPTRTVPTPAREIRPAAPRNLPAEPRPTPLPKRVTSEPEAKPPTGSPRAEGLASDAPPTSDAKSEPTALHGRAAPLTTSPPLAEPATPKLAAVDRTDTWPPPAIPFRPAARRHRRRFATARMVAAAVVLIASAGVAAWVVGSAPHTGSGPKLTRLQQQTAVNRARAAAWVKTEVSPGTTIACDKEMCSALAASGLPPSYLHVLGPTSAPPLDTALIIQTAAVRSLFGTTLDTRIAPAVFTTIGSGQAEIAIRAIAPHGVAAYRAALGAGQKARQENEASLLNVNRITRSAAARKTIAAGSADMRLIVAIADVAASQPVDIIDFGSIATDASSELPLRYADLAENDPAAHMSSNAYLAAMRAALGGLPSPYRPLWINVVRLRSGTSVLRIDEGAPSPLGFPDLKTANP